MDLAPEEFAAGTASLPNIAFSPEKLYTVSLCAELQPVSIDSAPLAIYEELVSKLFKLLLSMVYYGVS
jgi:hypothetical protein